MSETAMRAYAAGRMFGTYLLSLAMIVQRVICRPDRFVAGFFGAFRQIDLMNRAQIETAALLGVSYAVADETLDEEGFVPLYSGHEEDPECAACEIEHRGDVLPCDTCKHYADLKKRT